MGLRRGLTALFGLASLLLVIAGLATPAAAQTQPIPPENYTLDPRGVDLISGTFTYQTSEVVIGEPGNGGIAYGRISLGGGGWRDTLLGTLNSSGNTFVVSVGSDSEVFIQNGTLFTPQSNNGSTLTQNGGNYTFTTSQGAVAVFTNAYTGGLQPWLASNGVLLSYAAPNGEKLSYNYVGVTYCRIQNPDGECQEFANAVRLQSVTNNRGYQIRYGYASNDPDAEIFLWNNVVKVTGINMAVQACDPFVPECPNVPAGVVWPSVTYNSSSVIDQSGRATSYTNGAGGLATIVLPGQATPQVSVIYDAPTQRVTQLTDATGTWNYSYADVGTTRTTTSTGPESQSWMVIADLTIQRATSIQDALGRTLTYEYDTQRRLKKITQPEGDSVELTYDARGNVTRTTNRPKTGSSEPIIETSASYTGACTNPVICNKPTTTTDARGNVTSWGFDATHGGLRAMTLPDSGAGLGRPRTVITYAAQTPRYYSGGGTLISGAPITLPVRTTICATAQTCPSTANEVRTDLTYGTSGVPNNLQVTRTDQRAGTTTLATHIMVYDAKGDMVSMNGPLSGPDDTIYYRYDDARQRVGVIGPDPDTTGPLLRRASRTFYNADGSPSLQQVGTVNGLSDTDWENFAILQASDVVYDPYIRPLQSRFLGLNAVYSLNQVSYDAAGRPQCVAQRLNPTALTTPPVSACVSSFTAGFGPDRITQNFYDAASQLTATSTNGQNELATYTNNGQVASLTDGDGNTSNIVYDGHDRPKRLCYPGAGSCDDPTSRHYDEVEYDLASNPIKSTTHSLTVGVPDRVINATFDALNRVTFVDAPSGTEDITTVYDNLNRPLDVIQNGGAGQTVTMTWDALSRQISETTALGTMTFGYDPAGRRISRTFSTDGFVTTYGYDFTNAMTRVRHSTTNELIAIFAYDNLGRRISKTLKTSPDTVTTYAYDPASRLIGLTNNLPGTASDQTYGYGYNPSGQITGLTGSNPLYDYSGLTNNYQAYGTNPLNQITDINTTPLSYDDNGNLTGDGTRTYGYDAYDRLMSTSTNNATLTYDPLGRLSQMTGTLGATYLYDGNQLAGVITPGTTQIKWQVHGPWQDELLVAYQGSIADPRYSLQDHLGSVTAIIDNVGNIGAINRYDDYGQPQAGNGGRLMYTGQLWMPDFAAYHYKARAYRPDLGRFLQADPIGYAAGMNIYAYVGGDPVNLRDPFGLDECVPGTTDEQGRDCVEPIIIRGTFNLTAVSLAFGDFDPTTFAFGPGGGGGPQSAQQRCENNLPEGDNRFRCNSQGRPEMTPEYERQACDNYRAMMSSVRNLSNYSFSGSAATGAYNVLFGGRTNAFGFTYTTAFRGFNAFVAAPSITLYLLSRSPPPPGCSR